MPAEFTIAQHFLARDPVVRSIYDRILEAARKFGRVTEEPKKTSIHLVNKSAFAGVVTRQSALILNLKSAAPIKDKRILKSKKLSASRFHQQLKLTTSAQVDASLIGWLRAAYDLSG